MHLSSFRVGDHPDRLLALMPRCSGQVLVVDGDLVELL
jgi:hypothetical protein